MIKNVGPKMTFTLDFKRKLISLGVYHKNRVFVEVKNQSLSGCGAKMRFYKLTKFGVCLAIVLKCVFIN